MSLVRFEDVSVTFEGGQGQTVALDHIELELKPGDFTVVIGRSGCGKTTLLNLLAGFLAPSGGRVLQDGQPIQGPGRERGVVFQKNALMPWLSVGDNVALGLKFQKTPKPDRDKRVQECLDLVELGDFSDHRIYELSGGMQQRVGIARALAVDPDTLLMDEPLGALDALTRERLQELILHIWDRSHKQILFITHDIEEALFLGTRLVVMTPRPGRINRIIPLNFSRRFLETGDARAIKADPAFIALREEVLSVVHNEEST